MTNKYDEFIPFPLTVENDNEGLTDAANVRLLAREMFGLHYLSKHHLNSV